MKAGLGHYDEAANIEESEGSSLTLGGGEGVHDSIFLVTKDLWNSKGHPCRMKPSLRSKLQDKDLNQVSGLAPNIEACRRFISTNHFPYIRP